MPVPDELREAVTPIPNVLVLMSLMISLREVAPDKLMSPELPERSVMEIVPSGMPDPPLRDRTRTESSPAMRGVPWMVLPVTVVRPRLDAAWDPVEGAMLRVPLPPLVSVRVMPLPAELMAAESFD